MKPTRFIHKETHRKRGQVVAEYVMILTFVFGLLATAKIKISAGGDLDLSGRDPHSKTIMDTMSHSFTVWMQDILIIISLPS